MHSDDLPHMVYDICGRRWIKGAPGFAEAIANAHSARQRPHCLCVPEGVEMYVARNAGPYGDYIVKRMPDTGYRHAPDCPSYEPPADVSGLGRLLGTAINEDPATGQTSLRLGFSLTKLPGRAQTPHAGSESDSVPTNGTKLSLRGLLHYLWDQAELTRWHLGFVGKRTWGTVRRGLLQAAIHKRAGGEALRQRLYVPEPFSVDARDAIGARRLAHWKLAAASSVKQQKLMLLIGELKEIAPARYGFKVVVKHLPDQSFTINEQLYRRLVRRFETELALWSASEDTHMVIIATFAVASSGIPTIVELSMMPVTCHWLPFENVNEQHLLERLVADRRSFVKGLRYNLGGSETLATAVLTDCCRYAEPLFIATADQEAGLQVAPGTNPLHSPWVWHPLTEPMPALPQQQTRRQQAAAALA